MLTPRGGKDADERAERGSTSAEKEAPPTARRLTARNRQGKEPAAALTTEPSVDDHDKEPSTSMDGPSSPKLPACPVPALSIPTLGGSSETSSTCVTARSSAAAALVSARTARSAGALTARSGLKPETESIGMLTPRGGKDTDERAERGSTSAEKEAPPTARRFRARGAASEVAAGATSAADTADAPPGQQGLKQPAASVPTLSIPKMDASRALNSGCMSGRSPTSASVPALSIPTSGCSGATSACVTARSSAAAAALVSARTARSAGALTARSGLKPEMESIGMLTPRGGKDTDERAERSRAAKEAPPSSRRARDASESSQSL